MDEVRSALGLTAAEIGEALRLASLAPSVHNSQPWRFAVLRDRVELHADPGRRLPATDPGDRELRLACGAALFNLRIALEEAGVRPLTTLVPTGAGSGPLAVVRHGGRSRPSPQRARLLRAIPARRTNRRPFADVAVPSGHAAELVRATEAERAWLHVLSTKEDRATLRRLVVQAHRAQLDDPAFLTEFAAWTGSVDGRQDGVPLRSAGPRPEPQDEWVLRDFTSGKGAERTTGKDFESEPLVVVLCSFHEGDLAEMQAGQALQRLLLTATVLGLSASFLSQPIEVPRVRSELRHALGTTLTPQAVLRLGFGSPVPATPRRPVTELLLPQRIP
ncbi:Acg family FMN-binding oxidoreductase [Allokutzneria albata]|uniref:Nitroreductase family protein n=1 Tax=Allokutzneria albata TaxID=211114 RepID=A0A1G9T4X8_ALLAB|nr:nitroreductase family protein [Allokutzneria albata]SDM42687.1 Nitroreductase family protein [Allokutzneria albata]